MKKILFHSLNIVLFTISLSSCKKYLDINSDPDTPQFPDASSVFPTQLAAIPRGLQYDARYAGKYIQNWLALNTTNTNAFDRMGYVAASDANGDIWRQTYFGLGQNLNYIIDQGKKNSQWDYVGAGLALKALMFQYCTDYHGDIIFSDAFKENQAFFKFDDQESVYRGVDSMCRLALSYLARTDYSSGTSRLVKGDYVYSGDVAKWTKFTYGILARNYHRITNKTGLYKPDSVIAFCDKALASTADDFNIPFDAQKNDDANFFGTYRNNLNVFRQSSFIIRLLDGTALAGTQSYTNRDPRIKHMLSASQDTTNGNGGYRGVDPGVPDPNDGVTTGVNARKRIAAVWGDSIYTNPAISNFNTTARKYLFGDKVVMPVMTASEIQFMKAEAAYRKNEMATAYAAYLKGINLHFDFINGISFPRGNNLLFTTSPIPAAERAAYLAGANVKQTAATLTLSDIMLQKYIALWGWGFFETFVDMRRYHWLDLDPVTGVQVYKTFTLPSPLDASNLNKPVYRVRPRYNSEYVWNRDELLRIGGFNIDYHTYETWFSQP